VKANSYSGGSGVSSREQRQAQFLEPLDEYVTKRLEWRPQDYRSHPRHGRGYESSLEHAWYGVACGRGNIRVDLTIQHDDAKKIFEELYKSKDATEADMGNIALVWDRKPTTRAGRPIKRRQIFMTDPHDV
jgi:hypothetical protein